ncbi:hypothetical protein PUN28_003995 [Cardiocondyla obscurior]|uniref:Uncharacterized protein n=1 Tax=Cardiocondyla obscurior TaxID=286306 RepID=A0AAW2GMU1_9HYME
MPRHACRATASPLILRLQLWFKLPTRNSHIFRQRCLAAGLVHRNKLQSGASGIHVRAHTFSRACCVQCSGNHIRREIDSNGGRRGQKERERTDGRTIETRGEEKECGISLSEIKRGSR